MSKIKWTFVECLTQLSNNGWVYEGKEWNGKQYIYRWADPTKGDPSNITRHGFTLKQMRDCCREKFPVQA
jgi:hypothetical protein